MGLLLIASAALAQGAVPVPPSRFTTRSLLEGVLSTVVYSLVGIVLAIVGFKLFDLVIKFDLEKEICEKNNLAVAILAAAVVLGICVIVAFVVIS